MDRLSPVELLYDWVKREGLHNPVWSNLDEDSPHSLQVNIGKNRYKLGELGKYCSSLHSLGINMHHLFV